MPQMFDQTDIWIIWRTRQLFVIFLTPLLTSVCSVAGQNISTKDQEMEVEMKNVLFRAGDQLKVQGKIHADAERFQIDLGSSSNDLALHFNPRFCAPMLVCNSRCGGIWDQEQRDTPNPFQKGSTFKVVVTLTEKLFEVKLPDGKVIEFPNRKKVDVITYIRIKGDIKLTSFKLF